MKVVILGADGMLGSSLVKSFRDYELTPFSKGALDITNQDHLKKIVNTKPDLVINCAAYTDVDKAESDKVTSFKVNAYAVRDLARICKKIKCSLLHYSTDYVFDGKKRYYEENDKKNPVNAYGYSKAQGEDFLIKEMENFYIIRSSWLFGKNGKNFVNAIIKLARMRDRISVVNDQFGKPTYAKDLAEETKKIINKDFGIYHITNGGVCSWFKFAKEIIKQKEFATEVKPITSKQLKRMAKRPKYSTLFNTKTKSLRHWKSALKDYLR